MAGVLRTTAIIFLVLTFLQSSGQSSRQKRQIADSQPRIVTQNGHLIFQTGTNHNITFKSSAGGAVTVDGEDIKLVAQGVRDNKVAIDQMRNAPTSIPPNVASRLDTLKGRLDNLQPTGAVQTQLTNLGNRITTVQGSIPSNTATRLSSVENRLNNLQPTGVVQTQLQSLTTRIGTVETRVNRRRNSGGGRINNTPISRNRSFRRLRTRVQTLETTVQRLQTLLSTNECNSRPCRNGGTCVDMYNGYMCKCPSTWQGNNCETDVNECAVYAGTDLGCQNGATCTNTPGSFTCQCTANWHGIRCTTQHDDCTGSSQADLCGHGTCINVARTSQNMPKYNCICDDGWTQVSTSVPACTIDVNECTSSNPPCSQDPLVSCINTPGSFICGSCPTGYTGNGFTCTDVNECNTNNGGCSTSPMVECINTRGSRRCGACPSGYQGNGITCVFVGVCRVSNGGCHPLATCSESPGIGGRTCTCPSGYAGNGVGSNGCVRTGPVTGACASYPCSNGATCTNSGSSYTCSCANGYTGSRCETNINECASFPCRNGGTCTDLVGSFSCQCTNDYTGPTCSTPQSTCGGALRGETGSFRFPTNTGSTYPHGANCAWTITTTRDKILMLTFPTFDLEFHSNCNYDYLQIHDGPTASSHMLGKWCGTTAPGGGNLNTTSNQVYLWFYSDASVAGDGFAVSWTTADPVCGGELTTAYGSINSPGYPGNYPHNRDCVWTVSVAPAKRIIFTFATLRLENHPNCSYDYLELRDGMLDTSPLLNRYCSTATPAPVQTTGNGAWVKFHSDGSLNDRGFHITYATVDGPCGGSYTDDEGTIQSPNYPQPYTHNTQCAWTISVHSGDTITLTFSSFDLETASSCQWDKVEVRDGIDQTAPLLGRYCGTDSPAPVQSSANQMYIYFRSDSSVRGGGFQASWTVSCGGTFTAPTGTLQSPSYPLSYPHNKECVYIINQPTNYHVTLTFSAFDLEGSSTCVFDYLELRDGGTSSAPLIGRFCGTQVPSIQSSSQNQMWIKFKTDGSVANTGFQATYAAEEGCGSVLTGTTGQFQSPGHPNTYPHGANCTWYITAAPGMVVRLRFDVFSLEFHSRCAFDSVSIYDNTTVVADSLLGRYCGSTVPPTQTSTDNAMTVVFRSDVSIANEGFSASYTTLNASTLCGARLTDLTGVFSSPNYPNNYPHERECVWTIAVPSGNQILLNFTDFAMEYHPSCNYDYVEIRNGGYSTSPLVGKFCGSTSPPSIVSHSNQMYIKFKSDASFSARGFQVSYDGTATGCGADLTTPTGSFISPNYPMAYSHNAECFWTITVARGSTITLTFTDFDIESHSTCNFDYIQIRDGSSTGPQLAKYCGRTIPDPVTSQTNMLWIKYRTDYSVAGRGFEAFYSTSCNNRLTTFNGVIESPNFPNAYPHSRNCTWIIDTTLGNTINISFSHFDVESHSSCRYDYLQLRNGDSPNDNLIGTYCGTTLPPMIASTTENVWINFVSDSSVARNGFRLEWMTNGCGGDLTSSTGGFTSPNYPNPYPNRRQCEWRITVPTGSAIKLTIATFDLESHSSCRFDVLEVYGGPDDSAPRLAQLCHTQTTAQVLTTTGNTMFVRFKSDSSVTGNGFNATYTAISGGCGGNFSTPTGTILSKNYPSNYPHNTDCEWLITVQPHRLVQLTFEDFDVETHSTCRFDYVAVYDGNNRNTTELLRHCGTALPSPVTYRSTDNQMYVRMRTDYSVSARGFKATYVTGCGGVLNAATDGEIFSPNYPSSYERNSNCTWLIQSDDNSDRIMLTFTHMDVESLGSCSSDYVKVLDGNDANAPELGTYCGTTVPAPIRSQGSALYVIFVSDASIQSTGFRATYTKSTSSCGGAFTAMSGSFTSPGYPNSYPASTECVWTVRASPGNRIMVAFSSFSLATSFNCNSDYLELRSGGPTGTLIGRYCGSSLPRNLTAVNQIWMKFRSDSSGTGAGFLAQYSPVYGVTITGTSGQIASPNYPGQYPHNVDYVWTITTTVGMRIRVDFVAMDIEVSASGNCYYDYIRLRNGGLATSPQIGRYCATTIPPTIFTTGNQLRAEFHTDLSATGNGFLFNWTATNENPTPGTTPATPGTTALPGCGGSFVAMDSAQTLRSPGYPNGYSNNLNCIYSISSPLGTRIAVNITNIDLEVHSACNYDYVRVYDSPSTTGTRLGTFCGRVPNADILYSSRNRITIQFRTDISVNRTGFAMTFQTACGGVLPTATTGMIQSPNYPNFYPNNQNCSWSISVLNGRTISVNFNATFNIPSTAACDSDYVMLLNGGNSASPPLGNGTNRGNDQGRYCGSTRPAVLQTSSNRLFVNFVSDNAGNNVGFRLVYSEVAVTCGGSLTLTNAVRSGYFTSPNYPNSYPHNVDCTWVITAPANERIVVHFEDQFNIEPHSRCAYDYLEFRDGGTSFAPLIGQKICGTTLPSSQVSTGNVIFARFRTDNSVPRMGFKARYEIASCGGRINGPNGTITSPNYPSNYDANLNCEWYITTAVGHYITFTFAAFNLQSSTNCSADSLMIREINETGPAIFTGCGVRTVTPIDTSDSFAYVRFRTDSSGSASGFSVSFQASVEACGGDLTTPSGVLTSPNYPGLYAHNRLCEWRITVQAGRKISLTFSDFRLEASRTCSWDYIEVYNGLQSNSPRIGRYCGTTTPNTISSSGQYMRVLFRTDGSVTNGGFRASYTSNDEADCGGVLNGAGNITSPDYYNGNYSNNLECIWTINNPETVNSSIKIIVRDLALEHHSRCLFDFVNIREGNGPNAPLLQQFCGNNTIPRPIITPVPSIWMRFRTDISIVDRGFWFDFELAPCGGVLTDSSGVITTPNYPADYNHGDACAWQILAPEGTQIRVRFDSFDIENHPNCAYDYLQIFNGGYADSPSIGQFCTTQPPDFLSQSNALRVVFQTDSSVSAGGFQISYSFDTDACGGLFHSNEGALMSPNYPSTYPHNVECIWDINVDNGYTVVLTFSPPFNIETGSNCRYDYVQLSDVLSNGTVITRSRNCGTTLPDQFTAMNQRMQVKFRTDNSVARTGFSANWTTSCGGTFVADQGIILSPGYPVSYQNNLECNYTISVDPQKYVSLTFDTSVYEIEGPTSCIYDSVTVYAGNDTSGNRLGRFCGTTPPQTITNLGGVFMQFVTDRSITYRGFKINYKAEVCGGVYTGPYGMFTTISHPSSYYSNHNCTWIITVNQNRIVELKFTSFDLEPHSRCIYDYVEVRDGNSSNSPLIGRYCGSTPPDTIQSTGRTLFVNFITDSSVQRGGFRAAYRETFGPAQGCGGVLNNTAGGTFKSVDIDNDGQYENGLNCAWTIMMGTNKVATLNITGMDIEPATGCRWDYIRVYDGISTSDPLIGTYCGQTAPPRIVASTNALYVVFYSDGSITGTGFNATYGQQNALCGGTYTATTAAQTITSPNYPSAAGQALRCRWILDSSASNQQVRITFNAFSLQQDSACSQEYIELRDVPLQPQGRNVHYCGSVIPPTFDSVGRIAQVNYAVPDGSTSTGFSLNYQIASCSRNFTGATGRIVSPGWPGNYPTNANCIIRLTTPPGTTISLYFTSMYIEQHSSCNYDYLEVRNGTSSSGGFVAKLCGAVIPDPLFINGNEVYMNFRTDGSITHRGYDISYTSTTDGLGCGGNMTGINGSLTSPDFPGNFSDVATCRWLISVPARRTLTLTFETLSVQGVADCPNNYVAIYDGDSDGSQIIGRYCNTAVSTLTASGTTAYVKFVSTGSSAAPTFRLLYNS